VVAVVNVFQSLVNESELIVFDGIQADIIKLSFDILSGDLSVDSFVSRYNEIVSRLESFKPSNEVLESEQKLLLTKIKDMRFGVGILFEIRSNGVYGIRLDDVKEEVKYYIGESSAC
jgi:hypothetical protein